MGQSDSDPASSRDRCSLGLRRGERRRSDPLGRVGPDAPAHGVHRSLQHLLRAWDLNTPKAQALTLDLYFEHGCGTTPTIFGRVLIDVPVPAISPSPAPSALFAASLPDDPGVLRVYGEATAGVSRITAHLFSPVTGLEVASTSAFTCQSGSDTLGAWVSSAPLDLGQPGFSRVDTETEDRNGAHVAQTGIGYMVYRSRSAFQNLALNPQFVDVTRRTTQLTGI
jgi:hypothetical protein